MKRIAVIFKKEVIDNLRDRRSVTSALITSLFMPAFLVAMIMILGKMMFNTNTVEKPLKLPVSGAENAPGLVAYLKENGVEILPAPADPESAVRNNELEIVLIIPPDYGKVFNSGDPAPLQMVLDTSRTSNMPTNQRLRTLLASYEQQIASQRLLVRGINPTITRVLLEQQIDVSTPQTQTLIFLNMMPFLLIMNLFMGGMYVIIDTTAGERERGSLEPLLINPATRAEFILGKILASLPFALVILIIFLVAIGIGFNVVPLEEYIGFPLSIDISTLLAIFGLSLPMLLLASGLQTIVATFTRSFKEAQTYLSFLPLIAGLPGAFLAFLPVKPVLWTMLIPTFGQSILINQFMRGEVVNPVNVLVASVITTVVALILVVISIRLYQREQILFGGR